MTTSAAECCPKFHPEKWDKKEFKWHEKKFIMESIPTLFHFPFPPMIGIKIGKMCKLIDSSKTAEPNKEDTLVLFRDPTAFRSEIYISVADTVPGGKNAKISGTFLGRVFAGPYNAIPKFMKEMDHYLQEKNKKAKDWYVHYAYCPKCAKKYGDNYMILFAQVD